MSGKEGKKDKIILETKTGIRNTILKMTKKRQFHHHVIIISPLSSTQTNTITKKSAAISELLVFVFSTSSYHSLCFFRYSFSFFFLFACLIFLHDMLFSLFFFFCFLIFLPCTFSSSFLPSSYCCSIPFFKLFLFCPKKVT